MQRRVLARTAALARPQPAALGLGARYLNTSTGAVGTLNTLIETTKDSKEGFQTAASHVKSSDIKQHFEEYAKQRERFSEDLQQQVKKMGGTPETTSSTLGAIHRGWVNLKSAVTTGDKAIISEVVNGETVAEKYYASAINDTNIPQDTRNMLEQQHAQVQQSLNYARDLYNKL